MNNGKTISNSSSVKYNILNHENDKFAIKYSDKIFNNMRKQLTGFYERGSLFNKRRDFNYDTVIEGAPKIFYKYNGIFSNIYDSAFKNANLIIPFKNIHDEKSLQNKIDHLKLIKKKNKAISIRKDILNIKTENNQTNLVNSNKTLI